jgi:hypothetical protein
VISVDLEGKADGSPLDDAALATVDTLLGMLRDARMPATWASRRPTVSDAVTEALSEKIDHEIALIGDGQAGGMRRPRELAGELDQAQGAGYRITTLMCGGTPAPEDLQAICRLGIRSIAATDSAIAGPASWFSWLSSLLGGIPHEPPQPCLLRYGMWEVPAALALSSNCSGGMLRRNVQSAAACGDVLHVAICLPRLRQGRAGGLKQVEALLQTAFNLRTERQLTIQTIAGVVARLRTRRSGTPAQSILRRAA